VADQSRASAWVKVALCQGERLADPETRAPEHDDQGAESDALSVVAGGGLAATYGQLGEDFIECHHRLPLSTTGERRTRLSDLALVCSNCH
jgi:5-methylcytosine-specific restriction enzyme A